MSLRTAVARDSVRIEVDLFMLGVADAWRSARAAGRDYLEWSEWNIWARGAVKSGLVTRADLADPQPPNRFTGSPFGDGEANARFWRAAILKTWRRVRRAKDDGESAEDFHRNELAAAAQESKALAEMSRVDRPYASSPPRRRV